MKKISGVNIVLLGIVCILCLFISCSVSNRSLFSKKTPHEAYENSITEAGLKNTLLGTAWFTAAEIALQQPVTIQLPYKETGYFAAEQPAAAGYIFSAQRGEKLNVVLIADTSSAVLLFADLWQFIPGAAPKLIASADTITHKIIFEVNKDNQYLLRIQPELLRSGEFTVLITTEPTLAFPVPSEDHPKIGSFWGDSRDNGARKHEGIDIFGKFRTPVVAAAGGYITSVREGGLGGKVVFLRPDNKDYTLYYAHLDSQIVREGESVKTGDVVGLMGNTGNAKYTPTHLHFGIYTFGGAIDPMPFVNPLVKQPKNISASLQALNNYVRNNKTTEIISSPDNDAVTIEKINEGTALYIMAATGSTYKVKLPDGVEGFINSNAVTQTSKPVKTITIDSSVVLLDNVAETAAAKKLIPAESTLEIYGAYKNFYFTEFEGLKGWIKK